MWRTLAAKIPPKYLASKIFHDYLSPNGPENRIKLNQTEIEFPSYLVQMLLHGRKAKFWSFRFQRINVNLTHVISVAILSLGSMYVSNGWNGFHKDRPQFLSQIGE